MSSEWWSILAVFWGLYLWDGLRGGRRARLFFFDWRGSPKPRARVSHSSWFLTPPIPSAWTVVADDLPASLAPEGVTNWPSVSASRPPPLPEQVLGFAWEEITRVEERMGWIYINASRFAPVSTALTGATLQTLVRELSPLSAAERTARLREWQTARFRPTHFARHLRITLARSRGLGDLNTLQTTLLAALSGYLLLDGPARVPAGIRDALADALPAFLAVCLALHLLALFWFYRIHRRLHPKKGQERAGVLFTALFVPPQALRLRMHLASSLGAGVHPLAITLACANRPTARGMATMTLRDLRWPLQPEQLPQPIRVLVRSASAVLEPVVLATLNRQNAELSPDHLLAPPTRRCADACAYCPRCGDEFTRRDARCPHGVALSSF